MSRTKRAIAACAVVIVTGTGLAPVAVADRYADMQCFTNPAFRSMHEECEGAQRTGPIVPGSDPPPGQLQRILRKLPVVGGLF